MTLLEIIIIIMFTFFIYFGIIMYFKCKIDKEYKNYQEILLKYHFDKTKDK